MPASAISHLPSFAGSPRAAGKPNHASAPGQNNAFAAQLEKFLGSGVKKPVAAGNGGPLNGLGGLLNASLNRLGLNKGSGANLAGIREQTAQLKQEFEAEFRKLLAEGGFDVTDGINLQVDSSGEVRVTNDHPQKEFIESALKDRPELLDMFKQIATNSGLIRAANETTAFQAAYKENPQEAMAQYQHLFGKQAQSIYNLLINGEGSEESFSTLPVPAPTENEVL